MRLDHRPAQLSARFHCAAPWALVGCLVWASAARAEPNEDETPEPVFVIYSGHPECPDSDAFVDGVRARTPRARFVETEEASRTIEVDLAPQVGGTRGRLVIVDRADGAESRREVSGDDCAIVVEALALVAALAIDPAASLTPRRSRPAPEVPSPAPAPSPPPFDARRSPPRLERSRPFEGGPDAPTTSSAGAWRPVFAAQVQAASGIGSSLAPVLAAFGEVALDRDDWLSPSFRVALSWMPPVEVEGVTGSGSFWRWGGQASGCPIGVTPVDVVVLRPCLGFELGALKARGLEVDESFTSSTPWASVVVAGRAQLFPADSMLIELSAELGVPLIRPRYLIDPDATVVSVPPVYGTFGAAIGARLP